MEEMLTLMMMKPGQVVPKVIFLINKTAAHIERESIPDEVC